MDGARGVGAACPASAVAFTSDFVTAMNNAAGTPLPDTSPIATRRRSSSKW